MTGQSRPAAAKLDAPEIVAMGDLQNVDATTIRTTLQRLIEAGVIDSQTLTPILSIERTLLKEKSGMWNRHRIQRRIFDMPDTITNPTFLAAGGYGCVVKARYQGQDVAVKKIAFPSKVDNDEAVRLLREIAILLTAQEENQKSVCEVIDIYANANATNPKQIKSYYIVMPMYSPGCLEDFTVTTPELFKTIACHSLEGLYWLHRQGILHRDIKKENVFYNKATNRAVLGDLGSARRCEMEKKMTGKLEVGTSSYLAPEFLTNEHYSYASDVWSLGVVWWEMLTHATEVSLFPISTSGGKDQLLRQRAICSDTKSTDAIERWARKKWQKVIKRGEEWNEEAYVRIFKKIMIFKAEKRATLEDLYLDPFFEGSKKDVRKVVIRGVDLKDYDSIRSYLFYSQTLQGKQLACDNASMTTATGTERSFSSFDAWSSSGSSTRSSGKLNNMRMSMNKDQRSSYSRKSSARTLRALDSVTEDEEEDTKGEDERKTRRRRLKRQYSIKGDKGGEGSRPAAKRLKE